MCLLQVGDHIVCGDDVYGGTNRFFKKCLPKNDIKVSFVDATDIDNLIKAIKPNTKVKTFLFYRFYY